LAVHPRGGRRLARYKQLLGPNAPWPADADGTAAWEMRSHDGEAGWSESRPGPSERPLPVGTEPLPTRHPTTCSGDHLDSELKRVTVVAGTASDWPSTWARVDADAGTCWGVTAVTCAAPTKGVDTNIATPLRRRPEQSLRAFDLDVLRQYVTAVVDAAPPLTTGQARRLRALLSLEAEQAQSGARTPAPAPARFR
jgi:hypothetical protein